MKTDNCVALITGAAKRVGREIAFELVKHGFQIAIHFNHSAEKANELQQILKNQGANAKLFQADLGNFSQYSDLVDRVVQEMGQLDLLVNNASVFEACAFENIDEQNWARHIDINLKATFFLCKAAGEYMKKRGKGKIINIADSEIHCSWPEYFSYGISKAGVAAMTPGLAKIFAPEVQVNTIGPGTVLPPENYSEGEYQRGLKQIPLNRFGRPQDIASMVRYLVIEGDYITGQLIRIDGGYSLK